MIPLLRALSIGDSSEFHELVGSVLAREGIECLAVSDFKQALWFASPRGVDLIVVGIAESEDSLQSILATIENGTFGAPAPPVIVWTGGAKVPKAQQLNEPDRNVVLLAGVLNAARLVQAIAAAFPEA